MRVIKDKLKELKNLTKRKEHTYTEDESFIKNSEEWKKVYLSLYPRKNNYRSTENSEHAVCEDGECKIHVDEYSGHSKPIRHFNKDVPLSKSFSLIFIAIIISLIKKTLSKRENEKEEA